MPRVRLRYLSDRNKLNKETRAICTFIMRGKINTGQKENKLIKHDGKYEFGCLPGRYQILQQHIIKMETWSLLGARNGNIFIGKVDLALPLYLSLSCFIPH